jgi:hypothetical protein
MSELQPAEIAALYARFQAPVATLDCGQKCAPYNEHGVPFCCDTGHTVPTAYLGEWEYLQENTDLWHLWSAADLQETARLRARPQTGAAGRLQRAAASRASGACLPFIPFPLHHQEGLHRMSYCGNTRSLLGDQQLAGRIARVPKAIHPLYDELSNVSQKSLRISASIQLRCGASSALQAPSRCCTVTAAFTKISRTRPPAA